MVETVADVTDQTIKVPEGIMRLLRQSYSTREKALDWILAIAVVAVMAYAFRDQLRGMLAPSTDPNAGLDDVTPSQDINGPRGAFPRTNPRAPADPFTYNMPSSRALRNNAYPLGPAPPVNPSSVSVF